jgi:hypothetical protein
MSGAFARHGQRGQVAPFMTISLAALFAMAAYAIDVGIWHYQQLRAQTAADSGAVAAAANLANDSNATAATMYAAANVGTTANGFAGGATSGTASGGVTVTLNHPPASGSAQGNVSAVQVVVTKVLPVYFGWQSQKVSASAVAMNSTSANCLVTLATQYDAVTLNSGSKLSMPTCDMASNSWILNNSNPTIDAKAITYIGGVQNSATYVEATPAPAATAAADPCSTVSGCKYLQNNPPSSACDYSTSPGAGNHTLTPGTYCYTVFTAPGTITFNAGVYNFQNGFSESGTGDVNFSGPGGVTIYSPTSLTFGTGSINITAPTTGNTAGVALYIAGNNGIEFDQNTLPVTFDGLMYVPGAGASGSGSVQLDTGTKLTAQALVSTWLTLNSNTTLTLTGMGSASAHGELSE